MKRIAVLCLIAAAACDPQWIRPKDAGSAPIWGREDWIVFGIPSPGGMRGPRGLIRVGVPRVGGEPQLANFIAVEPVTAGYGTRFSRMGFSELDMSQLDPGQRGKRLWTENFTGELVTLPQAPSLTEQLGGALRGPKPPLERLSVRIEIEPFAINKAHVYVVVTMLSDHPNELAIAVYHYPDCAPIEELTTTATMGNYERLRRLWLRDRVVESRSVPGEIREFRDLENFPLDEMLRYGDGDALALCTTDEDDPRTTVVVKAPSWSYLPPKLTQYWRVAARHIQPDLRVKVNVRKVYWASQIEIPNGPAFENFEVRQRYLPGQEFIFGLTPKAPREFTPAIPHLWRQP